jgi:hypothetical protein
MFHSFLSADTTLTLDRRRQGNEMMQSPTSERSALWIDFAFVASCLGLVAGILAVIGQI